MNEGRPGAQFVADLMAALPADARAAAAAVVDRWRGERLRIPAHDSTAEAERRIRAARLQLSGGQCRADVVRVLVSRFGCSERQAWRDVLSALTAEGLRKP